MGELMRSQKREWGVGYRPLWSPLDNKLNGMDELVCFRIQFSGGVVQVIAREFIIQE